MISFNYFRLHPGGSSDSTGFGGQAEGGPACKDEVTAQGCRLLQPGLSVPNKKGARKNRRYAAIRRK